MEGAVIMNKNVFCIGELLIDMVCVDNKGLKDGEKFEKKAGGAPANVAAAGSGFSAVAGEFLAAVTAVAADLACVAVWSARRSDRVLYHPAVCLG